MTTPALPRPGALPGAGLALALLAGLAPAQFVLNEEFVPGNGMDDAALSTDGRYGILRQNGAWTTARIYDLQTGALVLAHQGTLGGGGGVAEDAVVANATRAAVLGSSLMLFDLTNLATAPLVAEWDVGFLPRDLELTPDGSILAVRGGSGPSGGLFLFDAQTGAQLAWAAGQPPNYPSTRHSFDVDSVAVTNDHAVFTSVVYAGPDVYTKVTIFDLHPAGGGPPQVAYETAGPLHGDQVGGPHDLAITADGLHCAVRSELQVGCYALAGAGSTRLWAARLAGNPGGFGDSALDSIEVTDARIATISRQSNPAWPLGAQLDLFDMAGHQVYDRVAGDPNDLVIAPAGHRLVVRTHAGLYLYDLLGWPAGPTTSALDAVSPAVSTHTSWGAGLDSVTIGGSRVVSLFRVGAVTQVFTHDFSTDRLQLVGAHTLDDLPVDLAVTRDATRCVVSGIASVDVVDLNTGQSTFAHQLSDDGTWPWCDGVVVNDERALAFGVGGVSWQGWVSVVDLFSAQTSYCTSVPNSTGAAAHLYASGSPSAGANDLVLTCVNAPPGRVGFFAYGDLGAALPFGTGTLCLGGQVARWTPQVVGPGGVALRAVDNGQLPGAGGALLPGSTWRFQFLFRDVVGGAATANASEGLELLFAD